MTSDRPIPILYSGEAREYFFLNIVERLLAAGANPFQRTFDDEGDDALEYARCGDYEGHHKGRDHQAIIERLSQLAE